MLRIDVAAPSALGKTQSAPPVLDKKHQDLQKATKQFEAYFMNELLKEMRKTVPKDTLVKDDGNGQDIFQGMMDQTLSESMSSRGDLGIAKLMYDQLAPTLGGTAPGSRSGTDKKA